MPILNSGLDRFVASATFSQIRVKYMRSPLLYTSIFYIYHELSLFMDMFSAVAYKSRWICYDVYVTKDLCILLYCLLGFSRVGSNVGGWS
jgi:hypothetical protein